MSDKTTITVNGRHYDVHTGLAVDLPEPPVASASAAKPAIHPIQKRATTPAAHVHSSVLQRSSTLNRKTLQRPQRTIPVQDVTAHKIILKKAAPLRAHQPSTRSNHITKFAPHPVVPTPQQPTGASGRMMDIGPMPHPHAVKAHAISKAKADAPLPHQPVPHISAHEIKQSAIAQAVANTSVNHHPVKKHGLLKRHPRAASIITATFAVVLLGGYLTYLNIPSLSVRVAAAQAGVDAGYPTYQPDGYSLNGVVGYSPGKVTMKFASNSGPQSFKLDQTKSNWDSESVLDKYVTPRAGVSYVPYTERGLTIYTFGNNAAWVNGGILYTIDGNAPLSSEQVRHIATSLI